MSASLPFHTLDVFTDRAFAGNPLAVVLEADGLETAAMQTLAREFNLSETVFVQKATRPEADVRVRIFTPAAELPFAGHPTIGTACLLAELGWLHSNAGDASRIVLEETVGLVPVRIERAADKPWFAELTTARPPELRAADFDVAALPAVLGLDASAVADIRLASCGTAFVIVTLRQPEPLAGIDFDAAAARRLLQGSWGHGLYVVARGYDGDWRTRMFAPDLGIGEDPATGAAATGFAGALALDALARGESGEFSWTLHQGVEMGRPSLLFASATVADGGVAAVRVGGHAVRISEGRIRLP